MAITGNSLSNLLSIYSQKSLNGFLADMPPTRLFQEDFSSDAAQGGQTIVTRIPNVVYGSSNDLGVNGWASTQASASAITITLATKGFDHKFSVTEWQTITPSILENIFFPLLAKQCANSVVVNLLGNITASQNTPLTIPSSSNWYITGSTSLQSASAALTTQEVPQSDRYCIMSPTAYMNLTDGVLPTYVVGSPEVVKNYGYGASDDWQGLRLLNIPCFQYARMYGALTPFGGDKWAGINTDKTIAIVGQKQGLVLAARSPIPINTGLFQTYEATDPTSKLTLQLGIGFDESVPCWRIFAYVLYGTALGNTRAAVPVIVQSS